MTVSAVIAILAAASAVEALLPMATPLAPMPRRRSQLEIPEPTEMASYQALELRAEDEYTTVVTAQGGACAYDDADIDSPVTCINTSSFCAFVGFNGGHKYLECCGTLSDCGLAVTTTCYDLKLAVQIDYCDEVDDAICTPPGPRALICSDSDFPYCASVFYDNVEAIEYFCTDEPSPTLSTYAISPSGVDFRDKIKTATFGPDRKEVISGASSSTSETSSSASPTGGGDEGDNSQKVKATNLGAIVGGTLGGLALLIIAGVLVFLFMRMRNQSNYAPPHNQMNSGSSQAQQPMLDASTPHTSVYAWQSPTQPSVVYPPNVPGSHASYMAIQDPRFSTPSKDSSPVYMHEVDNGNHLQPSMMQSSMMQPPVMQPSGTSPLPQMYGQGQSPVIHELPQDPSAPRQG